MRTETDPVSETLCFPVIYNSGRWAKSTNPVILSVVHRRQNPLDSSRIIQLPSSAYAILHNETVYRFLNKKSYPSCRLSGLIEYSGPPFSYILPCVILKIILCLYTYINFVRVTFFISIRQLRFTIANDSQALTYYTNRNSILSHEGENIFLFLCIVSIL
jgi:hypothetical protein